LADDACVATGPDGADGTADGTVDETADATIGTTGATPTGTLDETTPGGKLAFAVVVPFTLLAYVAQTRTQWFHQDEWAFFAVRDGGDFDSVMKAHNEHLSVIPVLLYRVMWNVVGFTSYRPYQVLSLAAHALVVVLLWNIVRRQGASAWVATVSASVLLFYGPGSQNATWAFQVGFSSGVAGGLACLLVADVDQPSWRRILAAIACGTFGIFSAGTGVIVSAIALVAIAIRRGPRVPMLIAVPLYLPYLWWWRTYQHDPRPSPDPSLQEMARFAAHGLRRVGETFAFRPILGVVVAVGLLAGLALVAIERPTVAAWRDRLSIPLTMLAGGVGFLLVTSRGRAVSYGIEYAASGRFSYTVVALAVPAIGVALSALFRRRAEAALVVAAILVLTMPLNLRSAEPQRQHAVTPGALWFAGTDPSIRALPSDTRVFPDLAGTRVVTTGMVARWVDEDRFPDDLVVTEVDRAQIGARLMIIRTPYEGDLAACRDLPLETPFSVERDGPRLVTFGALEFRALGAGRARSTRIEFRSLQAVAWSPLSDALDVEVTDLEGVASAAICPAPG
jgi:hypothetical protein